MIKPPVGTKWQFAGKNPAQYQGEVVVLGHSQHGVRVELAGERHPVRTFPEVYFLNGLLEKV